MTGVLGNLPWGDPMAGADFARDLMADSSSCPACASPDPAVIEGGVCSDCQPDAVFPFLREGQPEFNGAFG